MAQLRNISSLALCAISIGFGIYYILTPTITPWHQEFIQVPFSELPEKLKIFVEGLIDLIGVLFISLGIAYRFLWREIEKKTEPSTTLFQWPLIIVFLPILLVLVAFTFQVGKSAPIWAPSIAITLLLLSAFKKRT